MRNALTILDDFYESPMVVREAALKADYQSTPGQRFPGRNSVQKFPPNGLDRLVSHFFGEPVVGDMNPQSTHAKFRITLEGDKSRYLVHADPSHLRVVGVIYLTLPEHCRGGTVFYRHKGMNSERTPLSIEELQAYGHDDINSLMEAEGNDPDCWEETMTVPMRFNRFILYRPWSWHSAGVPFGDSAENGRLIQVMGFMSGQPS
jgi:hypothetical protein